MRFNIFFLTLNYGIILGSLEPKTRSGFSRGWKFCLEDSSVLHHALPPSTVGTAMENHGRTQAEDMVHGIGWSQWCLGEQLVGKNL